MSIEETLRSLWREVGQRKVRTYNVSKMVKTLKQAMTTTHEKGLKVIIAARANACWPSPAPREGAQRRQAAEGRQAGRAAALRHRRRRVHRRSFSCIRLSGCPSLTIKPNPDPLRDDPVAHVDNNCVGCGVCGEVSHAAVLCPSFYKAEIVHNPSLFGRALSGIRRGVIGALQRLTTKPPAVAPAE